METRMLTAHLPLPLAERLEDAAESLGMAPEAIIGEAIAAWLEREDERRVLDLRTIAGANALFVVETHRIRDWADSL